MNHLSDEETMRVLRWSRELIAIAQNGLTFTRDIFDRERFTRVRRIGSEMLAAAANKTADVVLAAIEGDVGYATP